MQKIPAIFKVGFGKDEKYFEKQIDANLEKNKKICALCISKESYNLLYNIVNYDNVDKKHTINTF